jgi:hypothetical protein
VQQALAERRAQEAQRAQSEDLAREVLDRLNQPSAAQAASRLADVIMQQRRG